MICPTCNTHEMVYFGPKVGPDGPFDLDHANCSGCKKQWEKCVCDSRAMIKPMKVRKK